MLYGIPQAAGKVALGLAGVTLFAASANAVAIIAEVARRAVVQLYDKTPWGTENRPVNPPTDKGVMLYLRKVLPYSKTESWGELLTAGFINVLVGTAALFVAHRYCPSFVVDANNLLRKVSPIQFTPYHIPLFKLFGC
jgi:hypothetical protein